MSGYDSATVNLDAYHAVVVERENLIRERDRLREAGERLLRTLDINLGCGHVDARRHADTCPYCLAKRGAMDLWDQAVALNQADRQEP